MDDKDGAWHDRMYNNRERVPAAPQILQRWAESSARARAGLPGALDLAYGDAPEEKLDVFPAAAPEAPVLFFIHGGYWRALDKSDHSFVAPPFVREGVCVVVPNYTLCPAITVPGITMQMVRALAWTYRHIAAHGGDPRRITVAGHSAGGQLAAMMLACIWPAFDARLPPTLVRNSLAISALHDLEPLMNTPFLQPSLRLTAAQVQQASPAHLPPPLHGELYSVVGGAESEEYLRQNALIRHAWGSRRVPVCEALGAHDHFSVLESLVEPGSRLNGLAFDLLRS